MPAAPEGEYKLNGMRSHLSNNPEKGRAGKRKINMKTVQAIFQLVIQNTWVH